MVYGKIPPQAKDLEEAILGAIMLERGAIDMVSDVLKPESFYLDAHQRVFRAMMSLSGKSQPIDTMTLFQELLKTEELDIVGGPVALTRLTNSVVSSANIEAHARIVLQKYIARELIRIGGEMVVDGYEDSVDVFDLIEQAESSMLSVSNNIIKRGVRSMDDALVAAVRRVEKLRLNPESISGVRTGYPRIDRLTNGWQPTDLVILAARPSQGKTAFALNLAYNAATDREKPTGVAYFSLEMSEGQLVERLLSAASEIHLERISRGRMDDGQMKQFFHDGVQRLSGVPIFIDDTAALNMFELRSKTRRLKKKHDIGMVIIDYLQLMSGDSKKNQNREQEISSISRDLKKLAKDLSITVVALSQMSRGVETRADKEPVLADLRESGAIEQDADIVIFVYGPGKVAEEKDASLRGVKMIKFAKHRNGALDEIPLRFRGEIQKFLTMEDSDRLDNRSTWTAIPIPTGPPPTDYSEPDSERTDDLPF